MHFAGGKSSAEPLLYKSYIGISISGGSNGQKISITRIKQNQGDAYKKHVVYLQSSLKLIKEWGHFSQIVLLRSCAQLTTDHCSCIKRINQFALLLILYDSSKRKQIISDPSYFADLFALLIFLLNLRQLTNFKNSLNSILQLFLSRSDGNLDGVLQSSYFARFCCSSRGVEYMGWKLDGLIWNEKKTLSHSEEQVVGVCK